MLRVKVHDSRSCLSGGDVLGRDETLRVKMHDSRSCLSGGDVLGRGEALRRADPGGVGGGGVAGALNPTV